MDNVLQHLLISTLALTSMMAFWYSLQRVLQKDRTASHIDFLKGRWGCGGCSDKDHCL